MKLAQMEQDGLFVYGPLPDKKANNYSYHGLSSAFDPSLPIKRSHEFSKQEFEDLIMAGLDSSVKEKLRPHIGAILSFSVDYQIDPFWIISIMMVESNFNPQAMSNKNALGLMQIKPDTAFFLYQLMQKAVSINQAAIKMQQPAENIEVGIFYLKKLLNNFRLDYNLATVAYNIGPNKLRSRLGEKTLDLSNFSYLLKVKDRYSLLSQNFSEQMKKRPLPYEFTFVVVNQGLKLEDRLLTLLSKDTSENLMVVFQ